MKKILIKELKKRKQKMIELIEIQNLLSGKTEYSEFAKVIKELEEENILSPVLKYKTNNKQIPLYNKYKINTSYFEEERLRKIKSLESDLNKEITLEAYDEDKLDEDRKWILIVNKYLEKEGFSKEEMYSPELSYKMVGDEKWIDFKGGKAILKRMGIWEKLKIKYNPEPLMLAINPKKIIEEEHIHLIVENKAIFYNCMKSFRTSKLTSLVFGSGWKVVGNISMLEKQLGLEDKKHILYYFGDLDYEGISIWNSIKEKVEIRLALPFYKEVLNKKSSEGKLNQNQNIEVLKLFISNFEKEDSDKIEKALNRGHYYPQEVLLEEEIKKIWRSFDES